MELERRPEVRGRVLHFAPERASVEVLRRIADEYVTTDLEEQADVQADITDLPFPEARWDVIVCSHVLEHVPDDRTAMRELRRILAPGGWLIVMVPRNAGVPTDEDPTVTDPAQRLARFGQEDHVRVYGDDLEERLTQAGFDEIEPITVQNFDRAEVERCGLSRQTSAPGALLCSFTQPTAADG